MKCFLIFNHLNDVIFSKYDKGFSQHITSYARQQGLLSEGDNEAEGRISSDTIMQIFSPVIASQRIMCWQFGNSYTAIQCQDGLNIVFDEFMGYLFAYISMEGTVVMKRLLGICITLVKHLCGPDVALLKSNKGNAILLCRLLDSYIWLRDNDAAVLVEAVEQLIINSDLSLTILKILEETTEKLRSYAEFSRVHALILVHNKFLSLYSSRNAQELSASDIIFLNILCESIKGPPAPSGSDHGDSDSDGSEEFFSPSASPQPSPLHTAKRTEHVNSFQVLLMGSEPAPKCVPHVVHIAQLSRALNFLIIIETGSAAMSCSLYETFHYLSAVQTIQMQRDNETLRPAFELLDSAAKKLSDAVRKAKPGPDLEIAHRKLAAKWDLIRRKYVEFMKTANYECLVRVEATTAGLLASMCELLHVLCFNASLTMLHMDKVMNVAGVVSKKLQTFNEFFEVKSLRNFALGSDSLTIDKYLEDFHGLVHFLYVDRTNHRVTAPSIDFTNIDTVELIQTKLWKMVNFSRNHVQNGHISLIWKDTTFCYAYFLWFTDASGTPLKPTNFPSQVSRGLPQPGILAGDFYMKLIEGCFPKMSPSKVRCYELFCMHLGLVTASCVLEHTRRLAATISEVTGIPNNPIDLL